MRALIRLHAYSECNRCALPLLNAIIHCAASKACLNVVIMLLADTMRGCKVKCMKLLQIVQAASA